MAVEGHLVVAAEGDFEVGDFQGDGGVYCWKRRVSDGCNK